MSFTSRIEIAVFEDQEAIVELLKSVDESIDDIDPDFTTYYIIRDNARNKLIGCIGLELFTGTALLRSFAVDPEYHESEMASELVKRLLDDAIEAGSEAVYVCATKTPEFFWNNEFTGIDLDDVPEEIRNSKLFSKDCPQVAAFVKKRIL